MLTGLRHTWQDAADRTTEAVMGAQAEHDIEGLTSAAICDAMATRFDHTAHILDLVSPTPDEVLFGQAATIRFFPNRRDHHSGEDRFDALLTAVAGTGHILVLGCGGHEDEALAGGKKVARIEAAGFTGILTDGRLRDLDEIAGFDLVVYCSGETVRAAGDEVTPLAANVPVEIDGVGVLPGDWIFADAAGAVVIPAEAIGDVLSDARLIEEKDAAAVTAARLRLT
jgi:regulator of RNase E activity RraA